MKKFFLFVLVLSVCALAADDSVEERVSGLQAQIDRAMAKAGIHFSGEFRSQFLNSALDGDAVGSGKKSESVEYTSVDFDILARPNTALSARAMFRLHQDWRNFFSDVQNPITTRWLSIDGSLMQGIFKYSVGDYHKKLTPLTLWAPDVDLLYEPEIFAQNRRLAMSEAFVGDNNRALQGASLALKAELYPILHEITADVFGARIAAAGNGESGVTDFGVTTAANGDYWDADYDRYLLGVNIGTQVIKGAGAGLSNILIFDAVDSYRSGAGRAAIDSVDAKLKARMTNIFAGRANVDNRVFMPDDFLNIGLNFEAALSSDRVPRRDPKDNNNVLVDSSVNGVAINVGLNARVALNEENILKLTADLIHNDANFQNDAAQSPAFIQRAIMNNENGLEGLGLLNPFDALYRSVFKYTPSQYFGGAKPYTKNAYTNAILDGERVGSINTTYKGTHAYPSFFQAALPGGAATADRSGPVVKFNGSFLDEAVTVGIKGTMLTTYEEQGGIKPEYQEGVGGVGVNIAKFAPVVGPSLQIGGSYGIYIQRAWTETKSDLISFGLDYNFVPRFSALLGVQFLTTANTTVPGSLYVNTSAGGDVIRYDYEFSNVAFGLSYKVADGGILTAKISMLSGTTKDGTITLINEIDGTSDVRPYDKSYTAFQPEVYLTVKF